METEVEYKQYRRFLVLNALYKRTNGNTSQAEDLQQIAASVDIKNGNFEDALECLPEDGFVKQLGMGSTVVFLTHVGKKAVERVYSFPNERSEHFPSLKEMGIK
jgi:hypothetical protein